MMTLDMPTSIDLFDYKLPPERIAQEPMEPRDASRLLLLDRATGEIRHKIFREIVHELRAGDVLVMNDSKVFKARLRGTVGKSEVEVFLLRPHASGWDALLKPGRRAAIGDVIDLGGLSAQVLEKDDDGTVLLEFGVSVEQVLAFTDEHGEVPTPPYVKQPSSLERYQTVYARETGSVAAPTAGFHFTQRLMDELKAKGVQFEFVTLHVGLGTFRPVKTATLEEHEMHAEFVRIAPETAERINTAKRAGQRVIAVGTTTVRALEGAAASGGDPLPNAGFAGEVNIFITPGFVFKVIDALITNFHLPKSTLLVLVSTLAGREHILAAYEEAVRLGYRFYSFGDAMFIQ